MNLAAILDDAARVVWATDDFGKLGVRRLARLAELNCSQDDATALITTAGLAYLSLQRQHVTVKLAAETVVVSLERFGTSMVMFAYRQRPAVHLTPTEHKVASMLVRGHEERGNQHRARHHPQHDADAPAECACQGPRARRGGTRALVGRIPAGEAGDVVINGHRVP